MKEIKEKFISLVAEYGYREELATFEICSNEGIDLAGSTIDKISVCGDNVSFYYNENTGDHDTISAFSKEDLEDFYNNLVEYFSEEDEENIKPIVEGILQRIFEMDDASRIADDIIGKVIQDIHETADVDYNDCDIEIAVQRVLKKKMGYEE